MASTEQDIATAQHAVAQEFHIADADVKARALSVTVPGITVFVASVDPKKAGRQASRTGIVDGGAVYVEGEAMTRVVRAWGYGGKRTVPAATVAQVFAALHRANATSTTMLDDDAVKTFKEVSGPKRAAAAAVPHEATIDGLPAVVYCLTSSARSVPFSVVTAVIHPDFRVELRAQPIYED